MFSDILSVLQYEDIYPIYTPIKQTLKHINIMPTIFNVIYGDLGPNPKSATNNLLILDT